MPFAHLIALGSSFAAGPGIRPILDRGAGRSARNYPHLLAAGLGARLTDLTVSGATTSSILDTEQRLLLRRFAPQIDGMTPDADLVTITAGGNDLRYAVSLLKAGWAGWLRRPPRADAVPPIGADDIERAAEGLARIVDAVHSRAPRARVLLVQYLTIFGADIPSYREAPFDDATREGFRRLGHSLNDAFERAAARSGAELVPVAAASEAHALGSVAPWVAGFRPIVRGIPAFHPNERGMVAVAALIRRQLSGG